MIKDDEDMLKLFEKMPDYLICEDKLDQTVKVLQVDLTALTIEFGPSAHITNECKNYIYIKKS